MGKNTSSFLVNIENFASPGLVAMGESSQVFLGKALAISAGVALMALGSAAVYLWNKRRIYKSFSSDDAIDASRSDDNDVVSAIETSSSSYNDKDTASVEADCSALANACRIKGNKHFKSGQLEEAQKCYEESLQHYPADHADVALSYSNLAAVHLSMKNYAASLEACNKCMFVCDLLLIFSVGCESQVCKGA